ncbi:tetratricopeptide repeat protein 28-like [Dendronephthya gigantea]|uniref:tetratricopeptide repeat protein 28-like n=1 Tax=Dendronephthya gigantea TaxID=151771 RepID=UPI00106D3951|nr:tetratricopeptide repeat protein 28-like [Dendronephthya gigantea]
MAKAVRNQSVIAQASFRLGDVYRKSEDYEKAVSCLKESLEISTVIGDQLLMAINNNSLGFIYLCSNECEKAVGYFKKMLEFGIAMDDEKNIANANFSLGHCYEQLERNKEALHYFEEMLRFVTAIGDLKGKALSNSCLGGVYQRLKDYEKAINHFKVSVEVCKAISDQSLMVDNNISLGNIYYCLEKWEIAIDYYKKTLDLAVAIRDIRIIAQAYRSLGHCYGQLGWNKEEVHCFKEMLRHMTTIGDQKGIADSNDRLGRIYYSLGENRKALDYYTRALNIYRCIDQKKQIEYISINLGKVHKNLGEYSKAIDWFRKSLEIAKAVHNRSGIALANFYLGDVYQRSNDYETAISYLKVSLEASRAIDDQPLMVENSNSLGDIYYCLGKWEIAIGHHKKTLDLAVAMGDQRLIAEANGSLGHRYCQLGRNEEALHCFEEMLRLVTAIGNQKRIAYSKDRLGGIYYSLCENRKALDYYKQALNIYNANDDKKEIKGISKKIGDIYMGLGEYSKAIDCFRTTLEMAMILHDQFGIAKANQSLIHVYQILGENEKVINYLEKSIEIGTAIDDSAIIAGNNICLGNIYYSCGIFQIAINHYKKALDLFVANGDPRAIAVGNINVGSCYYNLGKCDEAMKYVRRGLETATIIGDRQVIGEIYRNMGIIYERLGDKEKAIEYCRKSLKIGKDIGNSQLVAYSYEDLSHIHLRLGEYKAASSYLVESITILDELFRNTVPDENKLTFTERYCKAHRVLMNCFVWWGRIESGLLVIDLGRAKGLHFYIERKQILDTELLPYAQSIWSKIEKGEENQEIERIQKIFQVENDKTSIVVFAFESISALNVWVLNSDVTFKCLMSDAASHILMPLISELFTRTSVKVNRDSSFFKLDSLANEHSFDSHMISPRNKLCKEETFEDLHGKNPSGDNSSDETILKKLFDLLIQPIRDAVKGNKLIVVPDMQLFFIPFSSLIDENGRYLSQSYSIQVTPSLHTLTFTKEQPHDSDLGFALFVGNPKVGKVSFYGTDSTPADLPKAAEEVASLAKLFAARPLVKGEAKKQLVLGLLSGASIIHIAAHGEPERGEIMLAPDLSLNEPSSSLPNTDSYLLTQNDITSISLRTRLVVLCCCHTGQGEISSEGVIGIARSFLAAGARSLLATLWPICDDATKEFMEAFYNELLQETPVCEALRRAMNLFQQHEREYYRSFLIWAPFTLYGEDVMFTRCDIERIREKSSETLPECGFALFVGNPTSDLPKVTEEVNSLSKLFRTKAFVEGEARKQVLLGLLSGASIIHISAHIEPNQCAIMLSPCVSWNQGSSTQDLLTQQNVRGIPLKAVLVVLCLRYSGQDKVSLKCVKTLALSFLEAGARSVLTRLRHNDDDATTEFIKAFYNHLLQNSSVREALEKTKKLFENHDRESHRSFVGRFPFTIYGEDVMLEKHDIETIREKSRKMFSDFVVLPPDELTGSLANLNLQDKP